jgi:hypothetical protein
MRRSILPLLLGCLCLVAASLALGQTLMIRSDLWPDPGPEQSGFWKRNQGNLVVTVRSVGPAQAPLAPFYVKVEFTPGGRSRSSGTLGSGFDRGRPVRHAAWLLQSRVQVQDHRGL